MQRGMVMKTVNLVCPICGAEFKNVDKSKLICPYCGGVLLVERKQAIKKCKFMRK